MSATRRGAFPLPLLKYGALFVSLFALLAAEIPAQTQPPLSFFKNYFITGDYAVRGVSLWRKGVGGTAVAMIPPLGIVNGGPGGVPETADIVAAFLYIQTAESIRGSGIDNATFLGYDLGPYYADDSTVPGSGTFAKPLVAWENAPTPCWSVSVPRGRRLMTYRVDVLRFLPIDPATKKQDLTQPHEISVADAGRFFGDDDETCRETKPSPLPRALGASLLVVYRDPEMPLSAVVIYDGAYTKRAFGKMIQPIEGFYQASMDAPAAKMTHIVGDGRPKLSEQVFLGNQSIAKNPYVGGHGTVWDNPTFPNPTFPDLTLPAGAQSTSVTVDRLGLLSDCLTFSAMVLRTTVQDADDDGLVDRWEISPPPLDPNGRALPDLGAMEASPDHKDLFVQIDYMYAAKGTMYGGTLLADGTVSGGTPIPKQHTHLPGQEALKMVAEAFDAKRIKVHFDVGSHYQGLGLPYIIPANHARGGQSISETKACPSASGPVECATFDGAGQVLAQAAIPGQYPAYPGTVGWKTGFQFIRDDLLGFDQTRKDIFHYALFAHSIGMPKDACQIEVPLGSGTFISDAACEASSTDFHVPRTNSGIADFPGGDLLITLGAFRDESALPIGTPFMQGSTLMHELGHNFEFTHGGLHVSNDSPREPNCKPHYHSVMNYLYQLRGLPDSAGKLWMDYSGYVLNGLTESALTDGSLGGTPRFRSGWYAPLLGSYLEGLANAATRHCDGSPLSSGEAPMVRVDAASVGDPIDWNANGILNDSAFTQDINFDGNAAVLNSGSDDWFGIRLNQLGGRRSTGGYYIIPGPPPLNAVGPMSLDIGRGDIGRGDIGRGDIGRGDIGRGDIGVALGRGDIGRGDIGRGDIGRGDIGRGDIGRGDIGRGDIGRGGGDLDVDFLDPNLLDRNEPIGDLDLETSLAVTGSLPGDVPNSPATELTASLTGGGLPVLLTWKAPHLGEPLSYSVYRFEVADPAAPFPPGTFTGEFLAALSGSDSDMGLLPPATAYSDWTVVAGRTYAYYVVASFAGPISSGISNFTTVVAPVTAVTITSIIPATAAAGYGQMVTVFTTGAPAAGIPQAFFTQGGTTVEGFVWGAASQQNEYFVRLPFPNDGVSDNNPLNGVATGPASVRLVFDQSTFSQDYQFTVMATPSAPQARFVMAMPDPIGSGSCTAAIVSTTQITQITPGQCIAISAYGIDTTGAQAVFTQAGSGPITVGATSSTSAGAFGMAPVFRVPDTLAAGTVAVQIGTTVNGYPSALGNLFDLTVAAGPGPGPANYVVLNTNDAGAGSLRQAILDANAHTGFQDMISFQVLGSGTHTIALTSALPRITDPVVIDGTTQPGYGAPVVEVRGNSGMPAGTAGFSVSGGGSGTTIRGLVINNFTPATPGSANYGIVANGVSNLVVEGNYIGTDATGTVRVPNSGGVYVWNSTNTRIAGNLISGHGTIGSPYRSDGMQISGCTGTRIQNNRIGTNAAADTALGNAGFGIVIDGAGNSDTQITNNVISGNPFGGISIQAGAHGTLVQSNKIGTGADTAVAIPNGRTGFVDTGGINITSAADSTIESNTIAHNLGPGVFGQGAASTGNRILGNAIWDNARLGIDLGGDYGVTPNDDADGNGVQNFPVITSAHTVGGNTTVSGTLISRPSSGFWVEIFSNDACDPAGYGEGARLFRSFPVTTDTSGLGAFNETIAAIPVGDVLTATATMTRGLGPNGTSEFSQCFAIR